MKTRKLARWRKGDLAAVLLRNVRYFDRILKQIGYPLRHADLNAYFMANGQRRLFLKELKISLAAEEVRWNQSSYRMPMVFQYQYVHGRFYLRRVSDIAIS